MKKTKKQKTLDSIYKLSISSFIADSRLPSTSEYVYGYFSTLKEAKKAMMERITRGHLEGIRSFSIVTIPMGDLGFSIYPDLTERTYTPDGNLWSLEYGMLEHTISRSDSPNGKATIMVYPDCSSNKRTYFKIFNGTTIYESTKVATIMMDAPEYGLSQAFGKEAWILDEKEVEWLYDFLQSKPKGFYGETVWQRITQGYNNEIEAVPGPTLPEDLPIPDYRKLARYCKKGDNEYGNT